MRTFSVKATSLNTCHLVFLHQVGPHAPGHTLSFCCPRDGGYVKRVGSDPTVTYPVCIGLKETGFPLIHTPSLEAPLSGLVEYHAQKYVDSLLAPDV